MSSLCPVLLVMFLLADLPPFKSCCGVLGSSYRHFNYDHNYHSNQDDCEYNLKATQNDLARMTSSVKSLTIDNDRLKNRCTECESHSTQLGCSNVDQCIQGCSHCVQDTQTDQHVSKDTGTTGNQGKNFKDGDFDLDDLPTGFQTAFATAEEMIGKVLNPASGYRSSSGPIVIYHNITQLLRDQWLGDLAKRVLSTLPSNTWRLMSLVDGCCPVLQFHATNETLTNINGLERRIVHFLQMNPPKYQFIQHGVCTPNSNLFQRIRHRTCVQGRILMPLLIWDTNFNPPFTFDLFNIPTHCTCYNI